MGNTPWDTTSVALRPLLSQYGEIDGEILIRRGCAFVKYKTQESFEHILAAFAKDEAQVRKTTLALVSSLDMLCYDLTSM